MRKCLVKRCAALVTALVLFAAPIHPAAGSDNGHWAEKTLSAWAERGWLKGDGTGNLRPDDEVTRAEFASMINRAFGLPPASVFPVFSDLPETDWAYADIQAAVAHGYMKGYGKSLAGPHRRITREEAAVMIARLLGLDDCTVDLAYKDRDKIGWSASAVTAVSRAGILNGFPDGTFRPWHIMTRAEAVVSIDRALAFSKATGLSAIPEGNLGFFIGTQTTADVDGNFTLKDVTLHFFRPGTEKLDRIPLQYVKEANGDWHVGVENVDYRIAACDESGLTSIPIKPPVYGNTGTDLTINLDYVFRGKMKFRVVLTPSESGRRTIAAWRDLPPFVIIAAIEDNDRSPGVDGRDFTVTWFPLARPGAGTSKIYLIPESELANGLYYDRVTPVAEIEPDRSPFTWTGPGTPLDSTGNPFRTNVSYLVDIYETYDEDGDGIPDYIGGDSQYFTPVAD